MANNVIQQLVGKIKSAGQQLTPTNGPAAGPVAQRRPQTLGAARQQAVSPQAKNAAIIYGAGSLVIYGFAFFNLASAEWFNGLMLMLPATCLAYLAYRYTIQAE